MGKKLIKLNYLLIRILILAQPFIIMFQAMVVRDIQLFGLSVFESFNIIVSVLCVCLTIYTQRNKKIFFKYIPYVVVLGIYILAHGYHIYQFDNTVYEAQSPSFLVESYYIFRTFLVPLLLIFSIYYSGIKKEQIIQILEHTLFVIVSVMVVTNLLGVALRNYSDETVIAVQRLFDWFAFDNASKYSYYELTTKGWFLSGNQMSAVLFMTLIITVYRAYKKQDKFHYLLLVVQMLAMCMLGTKVANIGCILIMGLFIVLWCLFALLKHKKKNIAVLLIICVVFIALLPFTPVGYKYRYEISGNTTPSESGGLMLDRAMDEEVDEDEQMSEEMREFYENLVRDSKIFKRLNADTLTEEEKEFVKEYMATYCSYFGISLYIIENYDDIEHSVFWVRYLQETPNNDYRVLKTMILEDIYTNNGNSIDKYLGMGYTLNYIYTESDYTYQWYIYGVAGLIVLIGPYFGMLLYVIYQGLRHFKEMFTLNCAVYFFAPLIGLCVAKFSGHVLERGFPLLILAILMGILLLHTKQIMDIKEEYGNNE